MLILLISASGTFKSLPETMPFFTTCTTYAQGSLHHRRFIIWMRCLPPDFKRLYADGKISILLYLGYNSVNTISDTQGTVQTRGHLEMGGFFKCVQRHVVLQASFDLLCHGIYMRCTSVDGFASSWSYCFMTFDFQAILRRVHYHDTARNRFIFVSSVVLWICFPLMLSQTIPILTTAIPRRMIQTFGTDMLGVYSSIFAPMAPSSR